MRKLTPDTPLNPRQKRFVEEYLLDLNGQEAAKRAGYSAGRARFTAYDLLKLPHITKALEGAQARRSQRTEITMDRVLERVEVVIERCMQSAPVLDRKGQQVYVETPDGKHLPAYVFDAKGALKGLELQGSHLGGWRTRHELTGKDGVPLAPPVINIGFANGGPGESSPSSQGP